MKQNEPIAFWLENKNPITCFTSSFKEQSKRKSNIRKTTWSSVKDFEPELYTESKVIAESLNIGTVLLCKLMAEIGYERVSRCGKKYFTKEQVQELKDSDLLNVKKKSKLDLSWMVTGQELAEIYNVMPWVRYRIIEASGLKQVMRHSGKVYYDKNAIVPYFEKYKSGTLKFVPRKK